MPPSIREVLARIAAELEEEEIRDEFEALRSRRATWEEVLDAIRTAPAEARRELRTLLAAEPELAGGAAAAMETAAGANGGGGGGAGAGDGSEAEAAPAPQRAPRRRTRPGRKSGAAYDWYIDEASGEIVRSPVAIVYSGPDEPDEVEMAPLPPEEDLDEESRE